MVRVAEAAAGFLVGTVMLLSISGSMGTATTTSDVAPCPAPVNGSSTVAPCSTIKAQVSPCLPYLKGRLSGPSSTCCNGFRKISGDLHNPAGRRAVCECIRGALSKVGNYNARLISLLPQKCNVPNLRIPPIEPGTNCAHYAITA